MKILSLMTKIKAAIAIGIVILFVFQSVPVNARTISDGMKVLCYHYNWR